jgi:hypothetical protein
MPRKNQSKEKAKEKRTGRPAKESSQEHQGPDKTMMALRKIASAALFAIIIFLALDGYLNRWGVVRILIDWHTLELRGTDGSAWYLKSRKDFKLVKIEKPDQIFRLENLAAFDQQYREDGSYRLYFRISDSGSVRLQSLYQAISSVDSSERIQGALAEAQRAYQNLVRLLGFDTTAVPDTIPLQRDEWRTPVVENDLMAGQDDNVGSAVVRLLSRSPQVLVGLGIGIAASAGVDLLEGKVYLAVSREDCFQLDRLKVGARVGAWEGKSIDILWAFGKVDTPPIPSSGRIPVGNEPDSVGSSDAMLNSDPPEDDVY